MDRLKLTTIAHSDHVFCNPLSPEKVDRILGLLDLAPGSRVLDVGCGKAEMLIRLIGRFHAKGLGIDRNPAFLGEARGRAASRLTDDVSLELLEGDASDLLAGSMESDPPGGGSPDQKDLDSRGPEPQAPDVAGPLSMVFSNPSRRDPGAVGRPSSKNRHRESSGPSLDAGFFAAALCVGSTHALGGYEPTIRTLRRLVRPGGYIVVGEGFWKRRPDSEYLAVLDATPDDFTDHAGNVERAVKIGLVPLYASVSSEDDWDHYEGLYARAVERHVATHAYDPDAAEMRDYIVRWRDAYLRWGRSTLGFAVYLFQRPDREAA